MTAVVDGYRNRVSGFYHCRVETDGGAPCEWEGRFADSLCLGCARQIPQHLKSVQESWAKRFPQPEQPY